MMSSHARTALVGSAALVVALVAAGCSPGGAVPTSPATASPGGGGAVTVELQEWAVVPASNSAKAGALAFEVTNKGPEDVHEFVVIRTDLDPGALPTDATGAVDEGGAGIEVVDEIEDIPVGQTKQLSLTLAPGKYVLICNIYDETEKEAHYKLGMRIAFTAT